MNKIIIIKHFVQRLGHYSYDVLVHKDHQGIIKKDGYEVDCVFVSVYIKNNPEYVYLFSEDMGHIPEFNWIADWVHTLEDKKVVILDEQYLIDNGVDRK